MKKDSSGLSDPYLKISIGNQSIVSDVIDQTNNPIWNDTFLISELYLYGGLEFIRQNPPEIILDIYDKDHFIVLNFYWIF